MFLIGLCSQWRLAPALPKPTSSDGVGGNFDDKSTGLFTPPRAAGSLVPRVLKTPNPATFEEKAQGKEERQGLVRGHRRKGRKDAGSSYSRDAPTIRGGIWGRASASAKRFVNNFLPLKILSPHCLYAVPRNFPKKRLWNSIGIRKRFLFLSFFGGGAGLEGGGRKVKFCFTLHCLCRF